MKANRLTIGILAHVDAGKTTLSESILYETGLIKKLGRVDHKDAYLDTFDLEKSRGITIFSKQAVFKLGNYDITLLDTPGHVDFSAEMERTLRVLDYAVLVINGADGIQGHTLTVWKLLKAYNVPTFIFVNKMDLVGSNRQAILSELKSRVDDNCVDFCREDELQFYDELALCDEQLMEAFIEDGSLVAEDIGKAITRRHVFPIYFGSALKNEGVKEFLKGFESYVVPKSYPDIFGARVFKVIRNDQGERLTYIKVTGGTLKVKTSLTNKNQRNIELTEDQTQHTWQEKVDQIRIYSGTSFDLSKEVEAGTICALTGLSMTKPGDGLGFEHQGDAPELVPVLSYRVTFPEGTNIYGMIKNLRLLEEEEPHLNVVWNERLAEIYVQVMGEIQIEILKSTIIDRFAVVASFDKGNLVYRETIKKSVIGVGHFEPLKHYAEVHLLLEPGEVGSGMVFASNCSEDVLTRNWQRLVVSHLNERKHSGVLTGSNLTDMKVTLVAGRGHNKHTEGGDFREATFRALRQGLMKVENVLLEPVYDYTLELPKEMLGKAMSDIERMNGSYMDPVIDEQRAIVKGRAPVANMMHYVKDVIAYSRGEGRLSLNLGGYEPCHNQLEVVEMIGYDCEADTLNPAGSVFCSKGVGYGVPWNEADSHMHVDSGIKLSKSNDDTLQTRTNTKSEARPRSRGKYSDSELEAVFTKTYGERKEPLVGGSTRMFDSKKSSNAHKDSKAYNGQKNHRASKSSKAQNVEEEKFLLVDGYNIIFDWEELKNLGSENLDSARSLLLDKMCNYQSQTDETVIVVFDAYRVAGNKGSTSAYHNIFVVYTKEAETADQYIERLVHTIRPHYEVTVATSDVVEQIIILGKGARRLSADGLRLVVEDVESTIRERYLDQPKGQKNRPFEKYLQHENNE